MKMLSNNTQKIFSNLYESSTFKPKNKIELKDEIKNSYEDKKIKKNFLMD